MPAESPANGLCLEKAPYSPPRRSWQYWNPARTVRLAQNALIGPASPTDAAVPLASSLPDDRPGTSEVATPRSANQSPNGFSITPGDGRRTHGLRPTTKSPMHRRRCNRHGPRPSVGEIAQSRKHVRRRGPSPTAPSSSRPFTRIEARLSASRLHPPCAPAQVCQK